MSGNNFIGKSLRTFFVLITAAFATFLLFVIMLMLISTSFAPPKAEPAAVEFLAEDTKTPEPRTKAKLLNIDSTLLRRVELPPAADTKSSAKLSKPQPSEVSLSPGIRFEKSGPALDLRGLSPSASNFQNSGSAGNGNQLFEAGNSTDLGGANQCTLVAHIGPTTSTIAQIEVIDCLNGSIAETAEAELNNWVTGGAESYTSLGAQVGDRVEFTYDAK